ncbi:MAG: cupin domain-containing protein [Caldilineaceae bacterium]|nr:cupin domain-containing protein [Caldilineaceae bacterium]
MSNAYVSIPDLRALLGDIAEESIVSRSLYNEANSRAILFGFAPGQELSEHTTPMAAIIHILEGNATLTLGTDEMQAQPGTLVYMPPSLSHSVYAHGQVVMLLTMIKERAK